MTTTDYNPTPLIVRFGAFGDTVMLLPALERLYERYGTPCELISSGGWTPQLLRGHPAVGKIHLLKSRRTPYWLSREQRDLVRMLRQRAPGPVYLNETDDISPSWFRRAGVDAGWIRSDHDVEGLSTLHRVEIGVRLAGLTPPNVTPVPATGRDRPYPELPDQMLHADLPDCVQWIESHRWQNDRLVLVQPGNKRTMRRGRRTRSSNVKHWPESYWGQTIRGVIDSDPECRVLVMGVPAEAELAEDIVRSAQRDRVHNVANELPLRRLLALCSMADSLISVDTGPAHAAAAIGCPQVVLFQATNPAITRPLGRAPVIVVSADQPDQLIEPDDVVKAWQSLA